jgi:hypothetical protein
VKILAAAWSVLTWRHWAWMLAIALAMDVLVAVHTTVSPWWMGSRIVLHAPWWIAFGTVFLLALALVEGSASPSLPSMPRYFAGALAAAFVCVTLTAAFAPLVAYAPDRTIGRKTEQPRPKHLAPVLHRNNAVLNLGGEASFRGVFITLVYAGWRRSRHAERLLADAELKRARARRELLASQLAASSEVIDPDGVLRKLGRIEEVYAEDPTAAEALMDRLIEDLRAAIPKVRADLGVEGSAA